MLIAIVLTAVACLGLHCVLDLRRTLAERPALHEGSRSYGYELALPEPEPEPEPVWIAPEPWRVAHPAAFGVPIELLMSLADPEALQRKSRDVERVAEIRRSFLSNGPTTPIALKLDRKGHICIEDGHHRLNAAPGVVEWLPATVDIVDRITGWSQPAAEFFYAYTLAVRGQDPRG